MGERSLAHIERIIDIKPIDGADKIEVATVLGWKCVVRKGEFKVGDLAIYIEIDSIVDTTRSYFSFLKEKNKNEYRIKTRKFKGCISQGLLIP